MNPNEHHIKDIVYFMHDNKPVKGVVVGECKQEQSLLKVKSDYELIQCLHNDYICKENIISEINNFNRVIIINSNNEIDKYNISNGWVNSNDLYDNVNDLFCSLLEVKL